jgi:hypothetical protein
MWKRRLNAWKGKRFEENFEEEKVARKLLNGFESLSSMTSVVSAFDDSSLSSRQYASEQHIFKNRLSFISSEGSFSDSKTFDFMGESVDKLNLTLHGIEFEDPIPVTYSREKLVSHGFSFDKSKIVRMLSSDSLNADVGREDRKNISKQQDAISLVNTIDTLITNDTGDTESDATKQNERSDFDSRLMEKLQHLPKAELVDTVFDLKVKMKKVKKPKKKKSSSRQRLVSDLQDAGRM